MNNKTYYALIVLACIAMCVSIYHIGIDHGRETCKATDLLLLDCISSYGETNYLYAQAVKENVELKLLPIAERFNITDDT